VTDIVAKIAAKWKQMSDDEKKKFNEQSEKNKELYEKLRNTRSQRVSAYTLFVRDRTAEAREKGETASMKECAAKWKKVPEKVKEKYESYAKELKEEIENNRDMVELTFNLKPTKPTTAFMFFQKECYETGAVKGFGKGAEIKEKWNKLSDGEKEKFDKMAKKESLIYTIKKRNYDAMVRKDLGKASSAMNLYFADQSSKGFSIKELYNNWKNAEKETKKKYEKKAKDSKEEFQKKVEEFKNRIYEKPKRALSAYNFFYKSEYKRIREKNSDLPQKEMMAVMAKAFENLTEKQSKVFDMMSEKDKEEKKAYSKQYEENGYYIIMESGKKNATKKKQIFSVEKIEKSVSKDKKDDKLPIKSKKAKKV